MSTFTHDIEDIKANLKAASFTPVSINQLFKTTAAYSSLIDPPSQEAGASQTAPQAVEFDKKERTFTTNFNAAFIRRIDFKGKNVKNIEVIVHDASGNSKSYAVIEYSTGGQCIISEFSSKFTVRSKTKFSRPQIHEITISGYDTNNFNKLRTHISDFVTACYALDKNIEKASAELAKKETTSTELDSKLTSLTAEIKDKSALIEQQEEEIKHQDDAISKIKNETASSQATLDRLTRDEIIKQNNITQLEQKSKELNASISENTNQLARLVNEKSLISDEFHDYIKEGKGQSKIYAALMTAPFIVIILCIFLLYDGASDLLFGKYEDKQEIIAALLLRIPFATVLGATIYYSWTIANKFLSKIFQVQEERLVLAKLLVIAKDVVYSTADELGMPQSEKFEMRTRLKIEMLKAHLAHNIGTGFDPIPNKELNKEEDIEASSPSD